MQPMSDFLSFAGMGILLVCLALTRYIWRMTDAKFPKAPEGK